MVYVVTAARVAAETQVAESGGRAFVDFYRGAVLPDDVPEEALQAFLRDGAVIDQDAAVAVEGDSDESEEGIVDLSAMDKDELLAYADEHELQVDRRLGEDKLRAAIQEAQ